MTGIADDVSYGGLVTLNPEVNTSVSPVEHDQGAVLAASHQDVLVNLASCLDQQELYRLILSNTHLEMSLCDF